jgi:hypothetical protein
VFAGDSGAGKSYICSGNIVKHAQEQGIFVVLIDSENALDEVDSILFEPNWMIANFLNGDNSSQN